MLQIISISNKCHFLFNKESLKKFHRFQKKFNIVLNIDNNKNVTWALKS